MSQPVNHSASKTRLRVENLEARELMAAGITLGTDGIIRIEGYDDASQGEVVKVRTHAGSSLSPYDDQIQVMMTYGQSKQIQTFDIWKSVRRQSVRAVTGISYVGLGGNDSFTNSVDLAATAEGGAGDDKLKGSSARDVFRGGAGNDTLTGGTWSDILDGGEGSDKVVESGDGDMTLSNQQLKWNTGGYIDTLSGIEVAHLTGGVGRNVLDARQFSGSVTLRGGSGVDELFGGSGDDFLYGDTACDSLHGGGGADKLYGGDGPDYLMGEGGNDTLYGDGGLDHLWGGEGDDNLYGGTGKDYLYGEAGNDYLTGSYDHTVDHLYGGAGADTFVQYKWADEDSLWFWEWEHYKDKIHDLASEDTRFQVQV